MHAPLDPYPHETGFNQPSRWAQFRDAVALALVACAIALGIITVIGVFILRPAYGQEGAATPRDLFAPAGWFCRPVVPPAGGRGRPADCPTRAWCGCWLAHCLGLEGRELWHARSWTKVGRPAAGPAPGVIAVYARGRNRGHVGIVTRVIAPGRIVLLSGNDGNAVRERERSTLGVAAYRWR